jgi:hypothetical protein
MFLESTVASVPVRLFACVDGIKMVRAAYIPTGLFDSSIAEFES